MDKRKLIGIGVFFFLSLTLLAWMTVTIQEFTLHDKALATIVFPRVRGLRQGDPVRVLGSEVGKVQIVSVRPREEPSRRVWVRVTSQEPILLYDDYSIVLRENTLIGGQRIEIDPGSTGEPRAADPAEELRGTVPTTAFESIETLVEENRESLREMLANLRDLTERLQEGEGLLGRLLTDPELRDNAVQAVTDIQATAADLHEIVATVRAGEGTLGKLLRREELYDDAREMFASLRDAGDSIHNVGTLLETGEGTLGKLLRDPVLHDRFLAIADDIQALTANLTSGRGTLGKLWTDDELYDRLANASRDLEQIAATIREGKGTLGKLVNDETLHDDLTAVIQEMRGSLEDAREAAPIATFAGLLFSAF